jgi:hypothetical protein
LHSKSVIKTKSKKADEIKGDRSDKYKGQKISLYDGLLLLASPKCLQINALISSSDLLPKISCL